MAISPNQNGDTELFDLESGANSDQSDFQDFGNVYLTSPAQVAPEADVTMSNIHMGSHDERGPIEAKDEIGQVSFASDDDLDTKAYEIRISRGLIQSAMDADGTAGIPVNFNVAGDGNAFIVIENVPAGLEPSGGTLNKDGSITVRGSEIEELVLIVNKDEFTSDTDLTEIVISVEGANVETPSPQE